MAESDGRGTGGPVMSRFVPTEEQIIPDSEKSVFDWCKEGRADQLAAMVTPQNINDKDEDVGVSKTMLKWTEIKMQMQGSLTL